MKPEEVDGSAHRVFVDAFEVRHPVAAAGIVMVIDGIPLGAEGLFSILLPLHRHADIGCAAKKQNVNRVRQWLDGARTGRRIHHHDADINPLLHDSQGFGSAGRNAKDADGALPSPWQLLADRDECRDGVEGCRAQLEARNVLIRHALVKGCSRRRVLPAASENHETGSTQLRRDRNVAHMKPFATVQPHNEREWARTLGTDDGSNLDVGTVTARPYDLQPLGPGHINALGCRGLAPSDRGFGCGRGDHALSAASYERQPAD
jgi:hypothetical protein